MPHLPIEIEGGSVKINVPVAVGKGLGLKARAFNSATDKKPASPGHAKIQMHRFSDRHKNARIYRIEVELPGSKTRVFTPGADGVCSVRVFYVTGNEKPDAHHEQDSGGSKK